MIACFSGLVFVNDTTNLPGYGGIFYLHPAGIGTMNSINWHALSAIPTNKAGKPAYRDINHTLFISL
jgi:hypothetical protein